MGLLGLILILVLLFLVIGALPHWNHSRKWGYAPGGGLGLLLVVILILLLLGVI